LFSDILVIPDAMGQKVDFQQGVGPVLEPLKPQDIAQLNPNQIMQHLAPVFETVYGVRQSLDESKALIGFCGAPWTVATYMVGKRGEPDQMTTRLFAYQNPAEFKALIDILVEASILYLRAQLDAGADALQIFDSWSGCLSPQQFDDFSIQPTQKIIAGVRETHADALFIGFPKGVDLLALPYAEKTAINGLGVDWCVDLKQIRRDLLRGVVTQGNLDPLLTITGGDALDKALDHIIDFCRHACHIVNLGHGLTPQSQIEHIHYLIDRIHKAFS
jgi:uroporphyrinogen decarboxylase